MLVPCSTCGTSRSSIEEPCPRCSSLEAINPQDAETLPIPAEGTETSAVSTPAPTEIANRYRVVSEIGRGGFGVVYCAYDQRLGREIAIKRLSLPVEADSSQRERFEREARILASLDHPNIVPIFDAGLDDDYPYIAMKLVAGRSLGQVLLDGPLEENEALQILRQIAAGLAHAHSRGVVHRDVKPSNILEDEEDRIFLADFGLSSGAFHPKITQRGTMIGTLDYMAPEALSGECTERSDLYSMGAVLYKMIFGEPCFSADEARVLFWKICSETPSLLLEPPPEVSPQLLAVLRRMLNKDPVNRPESVEEVRADIERLLGSTPERGLSYSKIATPTTSDEAEPPVESLAKLESYVEEISRLGGSSPTSLTQLLKPLTHFIFTGSRWINQLEKGDDSITEQSQHAQTLSLVHLAREVERQVELLRPAEGEKDPLQGNLIHLQVRVLAPASELLLDLESRDGSESPATNDFFTFVERTGEAPLQEAEWIDDLLSSKPLRRHEAACSVVGSGLEIFLRELPARPAAQRDQLLEGLWNHADVLLLEGRGRSRPIFESTLTLATDSELQQKWRVLYSLFQGAGGTYWDPILVDQMLLDQSKSDRRVFGRALLIHPWPEYRRIALEILTPPDFWIAIAHERLPFDGLLELWRHLRNKIGVRDDYLKIFFVCVKDRLEKPTDSDRIVASVELVKELFQVDCFHETMFFKMLTDLERRVRSEARRHGLLADFDSEYIASVKTFRTRPAQPDQPVKGWSKVPLPIQRLLARRGHFKKHFACHPIDPIALECLPHMLIGEDVSGFLKLSAINARLLTEVAKEERLYQEEHNKLLLVANPKTPPFVVAKHISFLRADSLQKLVHSRDCNRFAHEYATRLLERRGRFRATPTRHH